MDNLIFSILDYFSKSGQKLIHDHQKRLNVEPVYIGTSGWSYKDWGKTFYPEKLPKKSHFDFYATQFPTVELNHTFYRLPTEKSVRDWRDKAPPGFIYAVKGSRFITHMKKLSHLDGAVDKFFDRIAPLKQQIDPILWQLPPFLKKDIPRLDDFLSALPRDYDYAVEFRNLSWLDDDIFALLHKHHVAHVNLSSGGMPMNLTVTADFIYIRFHGLAAGAAHDYTHRELEPWADFIHHQSRRKVFAYFNNDVNTRAPDNARMLMDMVGKRVVRASTGSYATIGAT